MALLVAPWFQMTFIAPVNAPAPVEPLPMVSVADVALLLVMVPALVHEAERLAVAVMSKVPPALVVSALPAVQLGGGTELQRDGVCQNRANGRQAGVSVGAAAVQDQ